MNIFNAVILGAVQGLTEFLPVSSSGHLVLLQKIFGIFEPALFFDTMLHCGTLLAVFAVLWRDIWSVLRRPVQPLTGWLILATIPAVAAALAFNGIIEHAFESGQLLGISFLVTTALLVIAELLSGRTRDSTNLKKAADMNWLDALAIGVLQAIAIIPGVSRSGATISGALCRKLDRDFAARFSFLLSIPAILGALVFQLKDLVKDSTAATVYPAADSGIIAANGEIGAVADAGIGAVNGGIGAAADAGIGAAADAGIGAAAIIAGTVSAAIVAFFAMRLMMKIIRERSLFGFAIYTAVLGTLVLIDQFVTHLVF